MTNLLTYNIDVMVTDVYRLNLTVDFNDIEGSNCDVLKLNDETGEFYDIDLETGIIEHTKLAKLVKTYLELKSGKDVYKELVKLTIPLFIVE